jgi:hypothetical protein
MCSWVVTSAGCWHSENGSEGFLQEFCEFMHAPTHTDTKCTRIYIYVLSVLTRAIHIQTLEKGNKEITSEKRLNLMNWLAVLCIRIYSEICPRFIFP